MTPIFQASIWRRAIKAPGLKSALLVLFMSLGSTYTAAASSDEEAVKTFKRMMLSLQVITETYAIDHKGTYAGTLAELKRDAQARKYWVDKVRYTERAPGGPEVEVIVTPQPVLYLDAVSTGDVSGVAILPAQLPTGVIYYRVAGEGQDRQYCIFALDGQGGLLKDAKGRDFYLSSRDDDSLCRLP